MDFAALRQHYFAQHCLAIPEDAVTLGLRVGGHLTDLSDNGVADIASSHRSALTRIAAHPGVSRDQRAELDAMRRLSRFFVHTLGETAAHRRNLELGTIPYVVVQHQLADATEHDDWAAIVARLAQVPRYLVQHERNLRESLAHVGTPAPGVARHLAEQLLPNVIAFLGALPGRAGVPADLAQPLAREAARAREAYAQHRAFLASLAGSDLAVAAIGEEEYAWRLRNTIGIETEPRRLVAEARERLVAIHTDIVRSAQTLAGAGRAVWTLADAAAMFRQASAPKPSGPQAVMPIYRDATHRAVAFIRERRMFNFPEPFDLGFEDKPTAVAELVSATNWPAPLMDSTKRGFFLVTPDPQLHPLANVDPLSVHEGIPGHYLQSLLWQRRFGDDPAPVRFLMVADHLALGWGYFGPMLNIEGFAAYAEELMLDAGFFDGPAALSENVNRALREIRIIVDIGLHIGTMTPGAAIEAIVDNGCMDRAWATREVLRYLRVPVQAITYALGAAEIWRLRRHAEQTRDPFDEAAFHDELLGLGPVPPSIMMA